MHVMNTRMSDILLPDRRAYLRETGASLSTTSNLFRAQSLVACGFRTWAGLVCLHCILRVKLCKKTTKCMCIQKWRIKLIHVKNSSDHASGKEKSKAYWLCMILKAVTICSLWMNWEINLILLLQAVTVCSLWMNCEANFSFSRRPSWQQACQWPVPFHCQSYCS